MLRVTEYRSLTAEERAKSLTRLFNAYHEYAKFKATGVRPSSKLGKLLEATNGDMELARYIAGMQAIDGLSKESAVSKANKMAGLTKGEKLLVLWLSGKSLGESGKSALESWLATKMTRKQAKEILG